MKDKKLNLNKYAFLDFLKSDFYAWIINNENYLRLAKEYPLLQTLTPHRWYELYHKKKANDLIKPSPMLDGIEAGKWARIYYQKRYPDLRVYDMDELSSSLNDSITQTKQIMNQDNFILFEGTFSYNQFNIKADVIIKKNGKYKLAEVKAVTIPLYYHALDIMFQVYILKNLNYNVDKWVLKLTTMNNNFYYYETNSTLEEQADDLFWEWTTYFNSKPSNKKIQFLSKQELNDLGIPIREIINDEVWSAYFDQFDENLNQIKQIQLEDFPIVSSIEERSFKGMDSDYEPFLLSFVGVPDEKSVFEFVGDSGFSKVKKLKLFNNGIKYINLTDNKDLLSKGIWNKLSGTTSNWLLSNSKELTNKEHINDEFKKYSKELKRVIQKYYLTSDNVFENKIKIKKHLESYQGVIYMFDFETVSQAVPKVPGTKVYEQVPYQYSIHVILDRNDFDWKSGRNIIHLEWLAKDDKNFYNQFWTNFVKDITKYGIGTYVSYNKSFENKIIQNRLERTTDEIEYKILSLIKDNVIDLMEPFANRWFYVKEFKGSYSIKYVGPYFVPEINYKNLDQRVQKGDQSAKQCKIWLMNDSKQGDKDWLDVRGAMLEYCKYDTLLMVAIFQKLVERYHD